MHAANFVLFGPAHLVTVTVVVAASAALPLWVRRSCSPRQQQKLAAGLGAFAVVQEVVRIWLRVAIYDYRLAEVLPLQLCSAGILLTAILLLWRSYLAYELVYFWGFSGTLQAILTPDLEEGFPHPIYLTYYLSHGLIILGALYATLVFRLRPSPRSIWRVYWVTAVYSLGLIAPLNRLLDTNYLYLRHKPSGASLMDYLGPWPWYLGSLAGLAWVFFLAVYLPFFAMDHRARKR